MNPSVKTPKTEPHHRLTLKDVIRDYQNGLLTAKGAIFYIVAASRKLGEAVRVSVAGICKKLEISKATYYRVIGELTTEKRIDFDTCDEMLLTVPTSNEEGIPDYVFLNELSHKRDYLSQKRDCQSQKRDEFSQKRDEFSHERDCLSQKRDEKPLEPLPDEGLRSPLSIQSLQSFSLSTDGDRERDKNADAKEEIEPAYREWLIAKSESLPIKPTFLEQWIRKQAPLEANQKDFLLSQNRPVETEHVPPPAPPDLFEIQESCQRAIDFGDRRFALDRLQSLIVDGWFDLVESLCSANNWGFLVSGDRVEGGT